MGKAYEPPIVTHPQSPEWDANHERMFGRRPCRGCKANMADEPAGALWCRKCHMGDEEVKP